MRILHLADVHLDTPFSSRSANVRSALRQATHTALERAVALAVDREVDAFVVAGDLFDDERLSFRTERLLLAQLDRLGEADIEVVYVTGNHDPGRVGLRAHGLDWPDHVTCIRDAEPVRVTVRDPSGRPVGRITGAGHETADERRDLAARFPPPEGEVPEIAVLHTQVAGSRGAAEHGPYAETGLETLRAAGYDYWALGHVHVRQAVSEDPPIHYPGNLQGRNPTETGPKGCLLVDLGTRSAPVVRFHSLAPIRWETVAVQGLAEATTLKALEGAIVDRWEAERRDDPGESDTGWIVRFELRGSCPLHDELARRDEVEAVEAELASRLDLLAAEVRTGGVHPPVEVDDHRERSDVLGEALDLLAEARTDAGALESIAPEVLAEVVDGEVDDRSAYLRSLLEGADELLAARMLERPED